MAEFDATEQEAHKDMTFGDFLRTAIAARHSTQQRLADEVGVSQAAVGQWCSGVRTPSVAMLARVVDALELDDDEAGRVLRLAGQETT